MGKVSIGTALLTVLVVILIVVTVCFLTRHAKVPLSGEENFTIDLHDHSMPNRVVAVSYSENSSGGHTLRSSILKKTVNQWLSMQFKVHVVSDCHIDFQSQNVILHIVPNSRHGKLGMPWETVEKLKEIGHKYDIVAYAEDDIFVHENAFDMWMQYQNRNDINVSFYRVETDNIHLTDEFTKELGKRIVIDGVPFVQLQNPYCAMWIMNARTFHKYCQSPWSSWETAKHITPWEIRETAAAGLTHQTKTVVMASTNVTHMFPPNGLNIKIHFTVKDLHALLFHDKIPRFSSHERLCQ